MTAMPGPANTASTPKVSPTRDRAAWLRSIAVGLGVLAALGAVFVVVRPRPNPDVVWNDAKLAFEARDFPRADALIRQVEQLRAPTPQDLMLRAQVDLGLDRTDEALATLAKVPDDFPMAAVARLEQGQIERAANRFDAAERSYRAAIRLDPSQITARRELIYILGIELRRDDLDVIFRELSERSPLNFSEVFLWCLSKGLSWDARENSATLGKVVAAEPTNRWARLGLASAYFDLNQFDAAEGAIASLPADDPDARAFRVRLALARGDDLAAETLLDAGPDNHLGLALLRGQMALARGDAPKALRNYRIAREQGPLVREAISGLAKALRVTGDPTASAVLEESRRLDALQVLIDKAASQANRNDPNLVRKLGAACEAVGRIPEARGWYRIAVTEDPLDAKTQAALNRLKDAPVAR